MQNLPHHYRVEASAASEGLVSIASKGVEPILSAPPPEYDGPGDRWSPETLLVGAIVDCFVLTFRAIARSSSFEWTSLRCEGEGELDRVDGTTRFTRIRMRARLKVPAGSEAVKAERLLEKAESVCLITNSLACSVELETEIET